MSFENSDINSAEDDNNPELQTALQELGTEAQEVGNQLQEVDIESLEPEEKRKLWGSVEMVLGSLMVLSGVALVGIDANLGQNWQDSTMLADRIIEPLSVHGGMFLMSATGVVVGLKSFFKGLDRFKGVFPAEDLETASTSNQ
jgi:hypothetical protein